MAPHHLVVHHSVVPMMTRNSIYAIFFSMSSVLLWTSLVSVCAFAYLLAELHNRRNQRAATAQSGRTRAGP